MPKRLAITIAGAVSLGSYEAGVLYEVLDAIDQHNSNPATQADDQIVIDVLTGASAGGMTAVILAQKLLFNGTDFKSADDNPLYNTWVKRIDLKGLQQTQSDEPALHSIFSSDLIEQISHETLLGRYLQNPLPAPVRHSAAAATLRLGVALTNLNGVDYSLPVRPSGPDDKFIYIKYGDQMTRKVDPATSDNRKFWEPWSQSAVACGAFPFAFRSKDMQRSAKGADKDDYPHTNMQPWQEDPMLFTYSDGGILQNQPLGMAKNLVDLIDEHLNTESRYYLFVSPNAKDTEANDSFHENSADYLRLLKRLVEVVIGQAQFQDWITAETMNKRVKLLDERAAQLSALIKAGGVDVPSLQKTANALLAALFPNGTHRPPGAKENETLVAAQARIAHQYSAEMTALGINTAEAEAFRDAILTFEATAGLGARDTMQIYGITATDSELAGAGLFAFLGFFDQVYRDHDYNVGRDHARKSFAKFSKEPGDPWYFLNKTTPKPIGAIDHRLDGLKLADVKTDDLNSFKACMKTRLNQALKELIGNWSILADPVADQLLNIALGELIHKL